MTRACNRTVRRACIAVMVATANVCPGDPSLLTLVINEIHYDPQDKTSPSEFVEVYNAGTGTVDLAGCYFSTGIDYAFTTSTPLAPGQYLVIAQDANEFQNTFGFAPDGEWRPGGKLQNNGETVRLRDANADEIDVVSYGMGFPWPTASHGEGSSLELINPGIDNDLGGAWRSSVGGPTPGARNSVFATSIPPRIRQVDHGKDTKATAADVTVSAKITDPDGVAVVNLLYQVVEPGDYIKLDDPRYSTAWTSVPMRDDGLNGDAAAGDETYTVVLPGSLQQHRRLIRYRLSATDTRNASVVVPYADDPQPNFAYFVYGALPVWTGSARPGVEPAVAYDAGLLQSIPVCHLITVRQDHLNAMHVPYRWTQADQQLPTSGSYGGMEYPWQGALVYDGRVYDHVHYRARGGVWRYAMGKNMWKFDFNRGHSLEAEDDYGRKYDTKWDKLNLSALIQQGNFLQRGEQGLFEAAGFKLHNLAGNADPHTHFLHYRIIADADEQGPDQYSGDFQGLYLVIEQLDGNFLDEHGLPDGNLYKMEGGTGTLNNQGPTQPADKSDLIAFQQGYLDQAAPNTAWWRANVDLADYYSFRAIAMAIHDYDIHAGKNFFYYHNPSNDLWSVFNWDLDLCWTTTYNGGGGLGPLYDNSPSVHLLNNPALAIEYNSRLREIRDLLFNPEQTGMLLDEVARVVYTPGQPSFVDADRAMWDYNPILISSYVNPNKASHGRYYESSPTGDFAGMITHVKTYVANRMNSIDPKVPSDDSLAPNRPTISYTGDTNYPVNRLTFQTSSFSGRSGSFAGLMWRIAEVTVPSRPEFDPSAPRKYEITSDWESSVASSFAPTIQIPSLNLKVGRRYRVRARMKDSNQRWSHWSDPVEFVTGAPDNAQALRDFLRVTEVMPAPPDGSLYEYVEVCNTSTNLSLDVAGVAFTTGIDFSFPEHATLSPGEYAVVVAAPSSNDFHLFRSYYGLTNGESVYGPYADRLSNGGETVTLKTALAGEVIATFEYGDGPGWPLSADGAGHALVPLVLTNQASGLLDYGRQWRASAYMYGSPAAQNPAVPGSVVINEFAAHTDTGLPPPNDSDDWLEIHNPFATPVDLSGWFLSDNSGDLRKYQFPPDTIVAANGFLYVSETTHFHTNRTDGSGFGLDKAGESLFLSRLPGDSTDRVVDAVLFGGQENNVSWGRYPDAASYWYTLTPTTNAPNRLLPDGVVISEVMYHALAGGDARHAQFVELYNAGAADVPLSTSAGAWRINGIDYTFPANVIITSGTYLAVVDFDPGTDDAAYQEFLSRYGLAEQKERLFGPFAGDLANDGERLALERPQDPDLPGDAISWVIMDEVIYSDKDPWPVDADGAGCSLARRTTAGSGNDPLNWNAAWIPTPGEGPRVVGLQAPPHNVVLYVPVSTQVSAMVDTAGVPGVSRLDFAVDGRVFHSTTGEPYVAPAGIPQVEGVYAFSAVLTDTGGGVHTSRSHTVTVYGPPPNPGINKLSVTFSGYSGSETLTGFPALVRLGTHLDGFDYAQFASGAGVDLRFTDETETRSLAYEIDTWNTTGVSVIWVRVPELAPGGCRIWAFWGDPVLARPPPYTQDGSVWSGGYAAVWHLGGEVEDAVGRVAMVDHASSSGEGIVGGARALDGVSAYLEPDVGAGWYNTHQGTMTVSVWANADSRKVSTVFGAAVSGTGMSIDTTVAGRLGLWSYVVSGTSGMSAVQQPGVWQYVALAFGGGQVTPYLDGAEVAPARTLTALGLIEPPLLGALNSGGPVAVFGGRLDEFRLSDVARSADWLRAEYRTLAQHDAFTSYQVFPAYTRDADGDLLPDRWELEMFGATNAINGGAGDDWDGDGFVNLSEFVAGTDATDKDDFFFVTIARTNHASVVAYPTVLPGWETAGRTRAYALERSTTFPPVLWQVMNDHTNRPATGKWNSYTSSINERLLFYRGTVRLK